MNKPHVTLVLGTARKDRKSEHVARYVFSHLEKRRDMEIEFADVKEYLLRAQTIPPWEENDETRPWRELVARTDAFVIVTPEYNHGYPGELKMLLDQDLKGYVGKPALTCGVSQGVLGGARVIEHLNQVYFELGLVSVPYPLRFADVDAFAQQSNEERDKTYSKRIEKSVQKLLTYAAHLSGLHAALTKKS